ncbi:MAG: flagellar hook-length control protein FliK [Halomonas sp.]|nr:flagellar hook-length control protein FliK [Halomonas sp.]TVP50487.1 MAG: flagellar hook-length control protein FliK [Halomonas sp.]
MNILQLLSATPSSPQPQLQGAISRQESPDNFFRQALLHASGFQAHELQVPGMQTPAAGAQGETSYAKTPLLQAQLDSFDATLLEALNIGDLGAAIETMGLDISEHELAELVAQLQTPTPDSIANTPSIVDMPAQTSLDEIAARLALMSSFSDDSTPLPIESSVSLEAIAERLNIDQSEAAQLVSALSALVVQNQTPQSMPIDAAPRPANIANTDLNPAQRLDSLSTAVRASSASPQVSSEALLGSLLTMESGPKTNQGSESLLTGLSLSAGQPQLAAAQPAMGFPTTALPAQATLSAPVTSNAWPQQLGQQLVQISQRGGEQHVKLQLNPAELGPLSISLKFSEQGAQAHFLSAHAQVRQVLEQAIPQLREALAEQGISLGETSVGEQRDPNAQSFAQSDSSQGAGRGGSDTTPEEASASTVADTPLAIDGRVDIYA